MAEKKYKVAENNSVLVKGVVLKSGEAIPAGAVSAEAIKQLVAAKLIVEDKGDSSADEAKKKAEEEAKKAEAEAKKKAEEEAKKSGGQQGGGQA